MKLEKGMLLTLTHSLKTLIGSVDFDNWKPEAWEIKDISITKTPNKKISIYQIGMKKDICGLNVFVDEETLKSLFTNWTPWRYSEAYDIFYNTNYKTVRVKKDYYNHTFMAKATCHKEDTFILEEGIKLAQKRLEDKIALAEKKLTKEFTKYKINKKILDDKIALTNKQIQEAFAKHKTNKDYQSNIGKMESKTNSNISNKTEVNVSLPVYVGLKIGDLEVVRYVGKDSSRHNLWECRCKCGRFVTVRSTCLRNRSKTSCGKCEVKNLLTNHIEDKEDCDVVRFINHDLSNHKGIVEPQENAIKNNNPEILTYKNLTVQKCIDRNLLEAPCYNYIVYTVSADYPITKTTNKTTEQVIETFGIQEELINEIKFLESIEHYNPTERTIGSIIIHSRNVVALIDKNSSEDTASYAVLTQLLHRLREFVEIHHLSHVAISQDFYKSNNLSWTVIKQVIIDEFEDIGHNLTFTVYK